MSDSTFWDVTVPRVMGTYANVIFAILWVGFAVALIVNREWLHLFARSALELGPNASHRGTDHRMDIGSPHHGGALDLGIFLVCPGAMVGCRRNCCLDGAGCIQPYTRLAIDFLQSFLCEGGR